MGVFSIVRFKYLRLLHGKVLDFALVIFHPLFFLKSSINFTVAWAYSFEFAR